MNSKEIRQIESPKPGVSHDCEILTEDSLHNIVYLSIQKSVSSAIYTAMSFMQEAIAKSVAQAINNSKPSEKTYLINTPSDQFWSSVESERNLAQGFRRSGKATQKRKHCFDGPAESPNGSKQVKRGKDQDKKTMRASRKTEECNQSLKRPSAREEVKRARKAIHRNKPDSYKTSSDSESSSISEDEKSDSDSASI
ncbi:Hypothetical predicted protein [Pelobates cultripes]|uniref:Uncharacterized protein n=1 Tax=Pelobates cultripes TaxID=61616 RepID=A0AAD1T2T6_PELCU|nr:Hypothetical predicted protein [Pelobates cultripes]